MSVYMIFSFGVSDPERFKPYGKLVTPVLEKHGGEVLVADFGVKALEGTPSPVNAVLRFPSQEDADAFYHDPEYAPLKELRTETTEDVTVFLAKQWVRPA